MQHSYYNNIAKVMRPAAVAFPVF